LLCPNGVTVLVLFAAELPNGVTPEELAAPPKLNPVEGATLADPNGDGFAEEAAPNAGVADEAEPNGFAFGATVDPKTPVAEKPTHK